MNDFEIIKENLGKIEPKLSIPDSLTKDKYPYYLDQPYLNIYGGLPNGGGDDNTKKPLTFKIISDGIINGKEYIEYEEVQEVDEHFKSIEYNKNDAGWVTITDNTELSVVAGDIVQFRGNNNYYCYYDENKDIVYLTNFGDSTAVFSVEGNIMSLIDSTNFTTATTLTNENTFSNLFNYCTGLTSAENLVLLATTLASNCYNQMFFGCTSLTTAPELPATTLANHCYCDMFNSCTSLVQAPELPVTTLANGSYYGMFASCTSLTTTPELPATTLADYCYVGMFAGCTSLTTTPELSATILAHHCYNGMFSGCTSLTTAPELPATTLAPYCYGYMFEGCTSLTTVPSLPATTLAGGCYISMFRDCTSLTTAPELLATTLTNSCYDTMFYGCTSLNYIKCLATDISASNCTTSWVNDVASTGTFVKNSNMSNWTTGINGIPSGGTVQNA